FVHVPPCWTSTRANGAAPCLRLQQPIRMQCGISPSACLWRYPPEFARRNRSSRLEPVTETYGTPQEVEEEYIAMEQAIKSPFPAREEEETADRGPGLFGVLVDPKAYGALIYMVLSLATGIFYFTWAVTGVSLTIGFAILIIGIPFALLFLGSIRGISW